MSLKDEILQKIISYKGVHSTHCCKKHGCKYFSTNCPVENDVVQQEYPCESCLWEKEEEEASHFCQLFRRIQKITDSLPTNFLHLQEEVGELATEILIEQGHPYKKTEEGVLAEVIDIVICCMAIIANKTDDIDKFYSLMANKISKWEKNRK
jgi:NTP pyrophosphatase (non-canonical NTP hydrolase)